MNINSTCTWCITWSKHLLGGWLLQQQRSFIRGGTSSILESVLSPKTEWFSYIISLTGHFQLSWGFQVSFIAFTGRGPTRMITFTPTWVVSLCPITLDLQYEHQNLIWAPGTEEGGKSWEESLCPTLLFLTSAGSGGHSVQSKAVRQVYAILRRDC